MHIGPIQFDSPVWLLLIPVTWVLTLWIGRRTLTGMGTAMRRIALAIRLAVLGLLAVALAEPQWRLEAKDLAVVTVIDQSRSMPSTAYDTMLEYLALTAEGAPIEDRLGLVTAAERARAHTLPSRTTDLREAVRTLATGERPNPGATEGTNLAEATRLALATKPQDAAMRLLLLSDGNETDGDLLGTADAFVSAGVPIDVLIVDRDIEREVIFEQLLAPITGRKGQVINVRMVFEATRPVTGRLTLLVNDRVVDLAPGEDGMSTTLALRPGTNVHTQPILLERGGPQRLFAQFDPLDAADDTIAQNNSAESVLFVSTEGRVLLYASTDEASELAAAQSIARTLEDARIDVDIRSPEPGHQSLVDLQGYDAIILYNVGAHRFSGRQQQELAAYVHDAGGGFVMVGGPQSFGAGGWIGTPVEEVLPVKLDPPQKRQLPRGALALLMHSCEMPQGNYWGKQVALAAVNSLNRLDIVGVLEFQWSGMGAMNSWVYPLAPKGDGTQLRRAINSLTFGDMPDFDTAMSQILRGLNGVNAGQKHCIIISDGDPSGPAASLLRQFVSSKISISTVMVFPHGGTGDRRKMQNIADVTGGRAYFIDSQNQLADLPRIFIKEAQVVRRALIWEGDPVQPQITGFAAEPMFGLGGALPPIQGYVVTAPREGAAMVTAKGPEDDPIVAQWQHGLGRAVAITTDSATRWSPSWVDWGRFRSFWEQHMRWVMRPSGSANALVDTITADGRTSVIVTLLDAEGDSLNFARFTGRVVAPDGTSSAVDLQQTGPGRYEGSFPSTADGSYLGSLRYDAPTRDGSAVESGAVQFAVSRPFADEHRDLKDNTPLLTQLAERTGGRVLTGDPAIDEPFSRDGLEMPVATQPIWLAVVLIGVGLFLTDVAVRRVRIDIPGIARAFRRTLRRTERVSERQIDALRQAREATRQRLADREQAEAKFEADEETLRRAPSKPVDEIRAPDAAPPRVEPERKKDEPTEDEGLSRLMQAKRRARREMDDDRKQE